MKNVIILLLLIAPFNGVGQQTGGVDKSTFKVYGFAFRYEQDVQEHFYNGRIRPARILTQGVIDPNKDQKFDAEMVKRYLKKYYPNKYDDGLCVLNWESKGFNNLKKLNAGDPDFELATEEYINLIKMVKRFRPNLQVGVYGLPFRFFYPSQRRFNSNMKLDGILKYCDFLAPSLYILYPDEQIGYEKNEAYLQENLQVALDYGTRLDKPVFPFVWYRVAPSNKKHAWEIISKDKMLDYLSFITSFSYKDRSVNGIIWWEQSVRTNSNLRNMKSLDLSKTERGDLMIDYIDSFINSAD